MKAKDLLLKSYSFPNSIWLTYFHEGEKLAGKVPDVNPHRHLYYELLFFKEAHGIIHHVDFTPFEVMPGSLFFIAPRQVHFLTRKSKDCHYQIYALTFSEDFLAQVIVEAGYDDTINTLFGITGFLPVPRTDKTIGQLWELMHGEVKDKKPDYEKLVLNSFRNLLVHFKRQLLQQKKPNGI